jgi:hypothetical protein
VDGSATDARQQIDEFLAGGDIGTLFRWVTANRRAVYASRDTETQELITKARWTIDGVLKGLVAPDRARDHLRGLIAGGGGLDRERGGPSQRLV